MTYKETVDWMFTQLPMFQRIGASAFKKDLSNTIALTTRLHHPEKKFKSVHIAGTNGKGSTSSMLASILQEAGYKVGLYTSPHLKDFRERIKVNGVMIPENEVTAFIEAHQSFLKKHQLSFFEMTVGMAFDYFAKQHVDVAIIEVGLGGRLDSTNIITPLLSVITNIGFDHVAILGNTLAEIAAEKAGIIKTKIPVVIGEYLKETQPVFILKAQKENAPVYFAQDISDLPYYESDLKGHYQLKNIRTVQVAVQQLRKHFAITAQNEKQGLLNVVKNTHLQGRWQILSNHPFIVADTAHNKDGLFETMAQLQKIPHDRMYVVFGVVNDKDLEGITYLLPKDAYYFYAKPDVPRGLDAHMLEEKMKQVGFSGEVCISVPEAYRKAIEVAKANDLIYVGGSTFVVAEIL